MATYNTPGVYVEEISTLPPSVAQVATAIPAFIGYTKVVPKKKIEFSVLTTGTYPRTFLLPNVLPEAKIADLTISGLSDGELASMTFSNGQLTLPSAPANDSRLTIEYPVVDAVRISSMKEFESIFGDAGGAYSGASFEVTIAEDPATKIQQISSINRNASSDHFLLYYCMRLFFSNGGGNCYLISVGDYNTTLKKSSHFTIGLEVLRKVDEVTLIVSPEATLLSPADYYTVCQASLAQCADLKDRFAIMDVQSDDPDATDFRLGIGTNALHYGAAYLPHVVTSQNYAYEEADITIKEVTDYQTGSITLWETQDVDGLKIIYHGPQSESPKVEILTTASAVFKMEDVSGSFTLSIPAKPADNITIGDIPTDFDAWILANSLAKKFEIIAIGDSSKAVTTKSLTDLTYPTKIDTELDKPEIKDGLNGLYNQIKAHIAQVRVTLPPSPAIAGIYARVDGTRGVWKAPANVSISSIIGPAAVIDNNAQDSLNIDPTAGKSINAIRSFRGKGTLVWGARTLAGNDNEWRYVSVRRLFITIEESVQKASAFAVFEPNDATTWLKVKAMIDNYLYGLWQQGALAGPTPESSYFVHVGLGKTMTTQDILEGRMIVEIGIAAVRPAEFILLKFSHKLQEA